MSQNCPPTSNLSLRQRQILELIRQGKSNHEIAFELGIGLGTVKQHVVALFRKLKVTSRTMAASQDSRNSLFGCNNSLGSSKEVILERRPCIVLSMVLEKPAPEYLRHLHNNMVQVAQEAGDIVLSWRGTGCDIILGIEQVEESDPLRALHTAQAIAQTHVAQGRPGGRLKGALAAGLAVASMFRRGGWSGEAIASSSIVLARHRTSESEPDWLFLDQTFTDLLRVCDVSILSPRPNLLSLTDALPVQWHASIESKPIAPRLAECRQLKERLLHFSEPPSVLCLWGAAGSGKSWLCARLDAMLAQEAHSVLHVRCLPPHAPHRLFKVDDESFLDDIDLERTFSRNTGNPNIQKNMKRGNDKSETARLFLLLDNTHWLSRERAKQLIGLAVPHNSRILYVSRHPLKGNRSSVIHLPPLQDTFISRYTDNCLKPLAKQPDMGRKATQSLTAMAGGNPFFIRELTSSQPLLFSLISGEPRPHLPLPIVLRVASQLDALTLDRRMLRIVSQGAQGITLKNLALAMGEKMQSVKEAVDAAIASSVLCLKDNGRIAFTHPMYQRVTHYLGMDI